MNRTVRALVILAGLVPAVVLAGCGGPTPSPAPIDNGANAAVRAIVNPEKGAGGTLTYEFSDAPDSFDPGNTYNGYMYNFSRLYARALTTFPPAAGSGSNTLVPDLAQQLGTSTDGGRTWTYTLRDGLRFSDGSPITSADVKYAVERSNFARDVLSNGPQYFRQFLVANPSSYGGPYRDSTGTGLTSIETPDTRTIIFHLKEPFEEFNYLVSSPQTAPVPRTADTGASYQEHIVSSGSYAFEKFEAGHEVVLTRNKFWSAATDPLREQNPDRIVLHLNIPQQDIDDHLRSGQAQVDLSGRGVTVRTQMDLQAQSQMSHTDNAFGGSLTYLALNTQVPPLDNLDCRRAVQYAIDKSDARTVAGGPMHGGIASTIIPPDVPGHLDFNLYPTPGDSGDLGVAKQHLTACGRSAGFTVNLSARADRPSELDVARSIQKSLRRVGINTNLKECSSAEYFSKCVGVPTVAARDNIGIMMMEWGADWNTGYGFIQQMIDGRAIRDSGNTNLSHLDDQEVNSLLDHAIANPDARARDTSYGQVDQKVMSLAVIVPLTYFKVLLYRSPSATNVVSSTALSGQYDYLNIGVSSTAPRSPQGGLR